jgi:hypothetical protein
MSIEWWWNNNDSRKPKDSEKNATSSTTNPIWTGQVSDPGLHSESLVISPHKPWHDHFISKIDSSDTSGIKGFLI